MIDKIKWEAFWDAPLYLEGSGELPPTHKTAIPAMKGVANQPGLPRRSEEVRRSSVMCKANGCDVKSNGGRIEISFPGVTLGVFEGRLQCDVFKGINLVRQVVIAKTERDSVAYKCDAGLKGLPIQGSSRVVWRDLAGRWQDQRFGGPVNRDPATVWSSNRLIAADLQGGSIAAFPPPHSFYGARESRPGARRHLLPQGQRHVVRLRVSDQAEKGRGPGVPAQLRADQRAAQQHVAADAGVLLHQPGPGIDGHVDAALTLHAQRSLPGAARLSDHRARTTTSASCRG